MVVLDGSLERQQSEEKSLIELIGDEKIHRRICSNNGEHQALCLFSGTNNTQALVVFDHGSLPTNDETIKFVHEFATFGTVIPLRNMLVAHFPDANIISMKFWSAQGSSEHYLLVVDSKGRAFLWRYAVSLSLWTIVTTFSLLQVNEDNDLILAMEYEEKTSTMLWIVHTNSSTTAATLRMCLGHLMISSSPSTHQRGVTVTSSAFQSDSKTSHNVVLIGPSVILSLPASDRQSSVLFSGCATNGIWIVMNTITSSSSSSTAAAVTSAAVYFYDCSKATLLSISLPSLLNDSKLSFCTEDTIGTGPNQYHPSIRITNESRGQSLYNVMVINEKLSIIPVPNDDYNAGTGFKPMETRNPATDGMTTHAPPSKADDCYALSDEYLHSLIDDDCVDDADNNISTVPSSTVIPSSSTWTSSTSAIPEISLSRSLFMEPSLKSGMKTKADSSISTSMMQLISTRASEVIRHLCTSREEIGPSLVMTARASASASGLVAAAKSTAVTSVLSDSSMKSSKHEEDSSSNEEEVKVVLGAEEEGVCAGSWIEEIDLIYLTPPRDPSFVLCKNTNSKHHHHSSNIKHNNSHQKHNSNHNSGVLEPFELILVSTLVRDMTDDANPRQVSCRDELEWILRDILWQRCTHKPDIAFETIASLVMILDGSLVPSDDASILSDVALVRLVVHREQHSTNQTSSKSTRTRSAFLTVAIDMLVAMASSYSHDQERQAYQDTLLKLMLLNRDVYGMAVRLVDWGRYNDLMRYANRLWQSTTHLLFGQDEYPEFGTVPYRPCPLLPRRPLLISENINMAKDITCVLNLDETESSKEEPNTKANKDEEGTMNENEKKSSSSSSTSTINDSNDDGSDLSTRLRDMLMNWTEPGNQPGEIAFDDDTSAKGPGLGAEEKIDHSDNDVIDYSNHPMLERCPWLVRVRMIETALVQDLLDRQQAQTQTHQQQQQQQVQ